MAVITPKSLPDLSKLESLDGTNYKRWSQKLLIFFEALELDYVLFNDLSSAESETGSATTQPTPKEKDVAAASALTEAADTQLKQKHDKDNKAVRGHLLNHMTNTMFDLFVKVKSAKQIWDLLERKYGADDT